MIKRLCKKCKKPIIGTKRIQFCSDSCRVSHWQREKRKENRAVLKFKTNKLSKKQSVETAQFQSFAALITLRDAALKGDEFAIKVLNEIDRQLSNIEGLLS